MNAGPDRALTGAWAALVIASLAVPFAILRHLVSLALVMAMVALALSLALPWLAKRRGNGVQARSLHRMHLAQRIALVGIALSATTWVLWRTGVLPW